MYGIDCEIGDRVNYRIYYDYYVIDEEEINDEENNMCVRRCRYVP